MAVGMPLVRTVGHSNASLSNFLKLLSGGEITAVIDVRSVPYSRFPHFGRERLTRSLGMVGMSYRFLGDSLGGKPSSPAVCTNGRADFDKMAATTSFHRGIDLVLKLADQERVALMCSEHEPLQCHRCVLVGRALAQQGVGIEHILRDGSLEPHSQTEDRLQALHARQIGSLDDQPARLAAAYRARAWRIAFRQEPET
jgi:uncharacterized protein (DUF488 family)